MSKLHELLAVENDLYHQQKVMTDEAITAFTKKTHLFFGFEKRLENYTDGVPEGPRERQELSETIANKLAYVNSHIARYFDAILQKEASNQEARADVILPNGEVLLKDMPVTFLLGMETRLKAIREMYKAIPTLPSGVLWDNAPHLGENVFVSATPEQKYKTAKTFKHKVLYEATDHHPAQIERWEENENVGMYITDKWTGLISPAKKSEYLARIDCLLRSFKEARQRGNNVQVVKIKAAEKMFNYINKD